MNWRSVFGSTALGTFLILLGSLLPPLVARAGGNIPFAFVPPQGMNIVWSGGGGDSAWSTAANWSGGKVPNFVNEIAVFNGTCASNCSPHVTGATTVTGILMESTYTGTIYQDSGAGKTLSVYGTWTMNGGGFSGGDATVSINGVFTQTAGTYTATTGTTNFNAFIAKFLGGTFNGTSGPLNFQNADIFNAFRASSTTTTVNTGTVFEIGATLNANGGTWVLLRNASGVMYPADYAGVSFNNLTIRNTAAGGAFFVYNSSLTVAGDLTLDNSVSSGSTLNGNSISVGGNVIVTSGYGYTSGTVIKMTKPGAVTINGTGATVANIPSLELTGAGTAATFTGTPVVNGNFNCLASQSNTVDGAFSVIGNLTANCALSGTSAVTFTGSTASSLGLAGGSFATGTLTVNKAGSTVTLANALNLSGTGQAMVVQSGSFLMNAKSLTVNGNLSIASGAVLTRGGGALSYGSLSNSGTLNP